MSEEESTNELAVELKASLARATRLTNELSDAYQRVEDASQVLAKRIAPGNMVVGEKIAIWVRIDKAEELIVVTKNDAGRLNASFRHRAILVESKMPPSPEHPNCRPSLDPEMLVRDAVVDKIHRDGLYSPGEKRLAISGSAGEVHTLQTGFIVPRTPPRVTRCEYYANGDIVLGEEMIFRRLHAEGENVVIDSHHYIVTGVEIVDETQMISMESESFEPDFNHGMRFPTGAVVDVFNRPLDDPEGYLRQLKADTSGRGLTRGESENCELAQSVIRNRVNAEISCETASRREGSGANDLVDCLAEGLVAEVESARAEGYTGESDTVKLEVCMNCMNRGWIGTDEGGEKSCCCPAGRKRKEGIE